MAMDEQPSIVDMLNDYRARTGLSFEAMAAKAGEAVQGTTLHRLARNRPPIKGFPDPRTIEALAGLLEMSPLTVLHAFAVTLGIPVDPAPLLARMLPPGTEVLTTEDRDAVLAVIRALVDARKKAAPIHEG